MKINPEGDKVTWEIFKAIVIQPELTLLDFLKTGEDTLMVWGTVDNQTLLANISRECAKELLEESKE